MNRATNATIKERRYSSGELRIKSGSNSRTIFGYAALFSPAQTQDMGGWREEIHPNAFDRCLRSSPDVVALFNHDSNALPLARTTSGTLRLSVDQRGLKYELDAPETTLANDLMVLMQRGDIHQSSYGFRCNSDSWHNDKDGTPIRTILDADLIDVSPVIFPATLSTTSGVRAIALRNAPQSVREALAADDACSCECESCRADDCENCSDGDCDDPFCDHDGLDEGDDDCDEDCMKASADGETERLRMLLKLTELRVKHDEEVETEALRQRLATLRTKNYLTPITKRNS